MFADALSDDPSLALGVAYSRALYTEGAVAAARVAAAAAAGSPAVSEGGGEPEYWFRPVIEDVAHCDGEGAPASHAFVSPLRRARLALKGARGVLERVPRGGEWVAARLPVEPPTAAAAAAAAGAARGDPGEAAARERAYWAYLHSRLGVGGGVPEGASLAARLTVTAVQVWTCARARAWGQWAHARLGVPAPGARVGRRR